MTTTHLSKVQPNGIGFEVQSSIVQPTLTKANLVNTITPQKVGNATLTHEKIITRSYYGFWNV